MIRSFNTDQTFTELSLLSQGHFKSHVTSLCLVILKLSQGKKRGGNYPLFFTDNGNGAWARVTGTRLLLHYKPRVRFDLNPFELLFFHTCLEVLPPEVGMCDKLVCV